jgi:hypothetical protein
VEQLNGGKPSSEELLVSLPLFHNEMCIFLDTRLRRDDFRCGLDFRAENHQDHLKCKAAACRVGILCAP